MDRLEKIQKDFTGLAPSVRNLEYPERLRKMGFSSIQRRYERYRIFYLFKVIKGWVPPCGVQESSGQGDRLGRLVKVPGLARSQAWMIREESFLYASAKLFNVLPKKIRNSNANCIKEFKEELDGFLSSISDVPRISGSNYSSNSITSIARTQ